MGKLQTWPLNLMLLMACSLVSYYFLERPLVRMGHRISEAMASRKSVIASQSIRGESIFENHNDVEVRDHVIK